ncbi:hypothetical protein LPB140_05155 [Sphingorhabdus lutea]|uniref:Nucleotidyl transferase AbiEii/AbiGii toxin family protein n=1 Tax=Sphingorhabdus lutea TaxID=1913578 RepID=A0A1L3JAX6_9SPHN|nr:hypothetical protein [Sphingorhabdus lutea]APG62294.1 hypothetical protein LPB140_05155 [Sphingorhabdus lutea]
MYRKEFRNAALIFADISTDMTEKGYQPPILVGGAAVELYTQSEIATGDFDVVTGRQNIFEEIMLKHGFERPNGIGHCSPAWINSNLALAFEVVGSQLLDGRADRERIKIFKVSKGREFAVISPEDLIADRMGQYASGTAPEMLQQAYLLFTLSKDLDLYYMDLRIRFETNDEYGIEDLKKEK